MSDYITDPELLAQLNGNNNYITDPALLAQLNSSTPAPKSDNSSGFWSGFGKGAKDIEDAGAQWLAHAVPPGMASGINSATQYVNNLPVIGPVTKALGMTPATSQELDQQIAAAENQYQQSRGNNTGTDWSRMAGNMTASLPLVAALPAAEGIGANSALGAAFNAFSQPVTSGDYATELAKRLGMGAVSGGATSAALTGLSKVISPEVSNDVKTLINNGVTPTPGQILGGGFKRSEEAATSIPVVGDFIKNAQRRAQNDLQNAAFDRALNPIGESLPDGLSGRAAVDYTQSTLGNQYDKILNDIGAITPDAEFNSANSQLKSMVDSLQIPDASKAKFTYELSKVNDALNKDGVMTSNAYKSLESSLGQGASKLSSSSDSYDPQISIATKQLQANLRDMLSRQAGDSASDLADVNEGWANFKRVQNASSKIGNESGDFTAAQLQNSVRALDTSKDKASFARGSALMQDLSDPAKNVLGNTYPDSGTALRNAVNVGTGALIGHSLLPAGMEALAAPAAIGVGGMIAPYTKLGQSLAARMLTQRPDYAPAIAQGVKSFSPYASIMGTTLANRINQ